MLALKRFMTIFLLLLTFAHVIDSDGPCDFEEDQDKHSTCFLKNCKIPTQDSTNVPSHYFIPDHIGHSPIVFFSWKYPQVNYLHQFQIYYPEISKEISLFYSEIFRPPLS